MAGRQRVLKLQTFIRRTRQNYKLAELRDKEKELKARKLTKARADKDEEVLTKVELAVDPKKQQTTKKNTDF